MANNVTGQVLGGTSKILQNVEKVKDVFNKLALTGNYTASVNGDPADMNDELSDYSFVSFATAVKGGN